METAKHRLFQFLSADTLPDNMLVCVASEAALHLGVLSSSTSLAWTYANCGLMGVAKFEQGHRYTKTQVFDPFPFPMQATTLRASSPTWRRNSTPPASASLRRCRT
ncbi:hypothetical protein P0F65_00875 [Sphingomonas sp. I4]